MIEAMGITLRESIEAILIIFIMVAYLRRLGEDEKIRYVYGGALAAAAASIALAGLLSAAGMQDGFEAWEGILYLVAGGLVLSLTIWMIRHGRHFKKEVESAVGRSSDVMGLALVAFFMVFREGVETVIFLQSLLLSGASRVGNAFGGFAGVLLALAFAVVFLKGPLHINLSRFLNITAVILFALAGSLFARGIHEFFEQGFLPQWEGGEELTEFLSANATVTALISLILLVMAVSVLYDMVTASPPDWSALPQPERQLEAARFRVQKKRKTGIAALVAVIVVGVLLSAGIM